MGRFDLNEKLIQVVTGAVSSSIKSSDIYTTLYNEFYDSCNAAAEKIKEENEMLVDAIEGIAQAFGVEIDYCGDIKKRVSDLKKEIIKRSATDKPKQRYLLLGYMDEYGHAHSTCVASKDIEYLKEVYAMFNDDMDFSSLYLEDQKLVDAMADKLKCDKDELYNATDDELSDKIEEFFKVLVDDDTVSREEFSEYLECVIGNSCSRDKTISWVAL